MTKYINILKKRMRTRRLQKKSASAEQYVAVTKSGKIIRLKEVSKEYIEANRPSAYEYRF